MKSKGTALILLGLLLVAAALSLVVYNLVDSLRAERTAAEAITVLEDRIPGEKPAQPDENPVATESSSLESGELPSEYGELPIEFDDSLETPPDYLLNPNVEMPVETVDGVDYIGILYIPALDLNLPIISQWSYPNLKLSPCRYSGSVYKNNLVLCGHNYATHFLSLKNLRQGDSLTFTDMDGNTFYFQVSALETLQPTAVEEMTTGDWDLTLFTCTVGGQTRLAVRCVSAE